jgi:competence protein ComEC
MKIKSIPNYRLLTYFLVSYLLGVFVSSFYSFNFVRTWQALLCFFLFEAGIILLIKSGQIGRLIIICSCALFLGIINFSHTNTKLNEQQLPFSEKKEFIASIVSYPEHESNKQSFFAKTDDFGTGKKIYFKTGRYPEYEYGDKIRVSGKIEKPKNYSDFDWINYLKRFSAIASINNPNIEKISSGQGNILTSRLYQFKNSLESIIEKNLPEPESSLAKGILVGSRESFSDDLINKFNKVGITHIIALSGFNITIIVVFISMIMIGVVGRKYNLLFSVVFVISFVIMTGASASVVRAAIISLLLAYGATLGRRADKANLLLFAAGVMVAINPFVLRFDVGFQLSFLAYLGLVYFSETIMRILSWKKLSLVPRSLKLVLSETLSAQTIVLPLLLTTFGRISLIAPISNLLILPLIPLSMLIVFISIIVYLLCPIAGQGFFMISFLPLKYIILVAKYLSQLPLSSIEIAENLQIILSIVYILFLVIIFIYLKFKWQKKLTI